MTALRPPYCMCPSLACPLHPADVRDALIAAWCQPHPPLNPLPDPRCTCERCDAARKVLAP